MWVQKQLQLRPFPRGFQLITDQIADTIPEIGQVDVGLLHVFIQHTSASLTINENADPDVRIDFESTMSRVVSESFPYVHTLEGPDDMPAHIKASMMGSSVTIPVGGGRMQLGTWQGVYLCEHRNRATGRRLILTLHGESAGDQ
ncbi:MAG: secondary thiamine-phosphate synthase enzyme YjbQ [Pirellulaceae bacterium]|nr:YjbQ family protein [Planctomycetaceae bacterium]